MFPVILISPSASSSSDCSPDDPLIVGLIATTADLFCMEGEEGIPMCALTSLFCNLEGSFPEGPDPTKKVQIKM